MPYLRKATRTAIDKGCPPATPGELNYVFTRVALDYLEREGTTYAAIAEIVSAFECAKLEFYRRVAAPYEDVKCRENGDVY